MKIHSKLLIKKEIISFFIKKIMTTYFTLHNFWWRRQHQDGRNKRWEAGKCCDFGSKDDDIVCNWDMWIYLKFRNVYLFVQLNDSELKRDLWEKFNIFLGVSRVWNVKTDRSCLALHHVHVTGLWLCVIWFHFRHY